MTTLYDTIFALKQELAASCDADEIQQIKAELNAAEIEQAKLDSALDEALDAEFRKAAASERRLR